MERVYISGPITGHPEWREEFGRAELELKGRGYEVVNPARIGDRLSRKFPHWEIGYADYMRADIDALLDCDAIYMLPGWEGSTGAKLELHVATVLGLEVTRAAE